MYDNYDDERNESSSMNTQDQSDSGSTQSGDGIYRMKFNSGEKTGSSADSYDGQGSYSSTGSYSSGTAGGSTYQSENTTYQSSSAYGSTQNSAGSTGSGSYDNQNGYRSYETVGSSEPKRPKKKKKGGFGRQLVKVVCFAVIFGLIAGFTMWGVNTAMSGSDSDSSLTTDDTSEATGFSLNVVKVSTTDVETIEGTDVADVVAEVMPSIVAVTTVIETTTQDILGRTYSSESSGAGSGIIFSEDDGYLYILTNYHVVEDSTSVSIVFCDDSTADATVYGYSESDDIALLQLDMSQLSDDTKSAIAVAVMGDSDEISVGDGAIAIGNALGYGQSVTTGTISAVDREVTMTDGTMIMIQTDAAINEGNSGGALLNTKGEVIGINSAKLYGDTIEGMGYAIPINTALEVVDQILSGEIVNKTDDETAALGILGGTVTESLVSNYGYPAGVYVSAVYDNSAAQLAGIEVGYIITGFNDIEITSMDELQSALAECSPGDEVTITVMIPDDSGTYSTTQTLTTVLGSYSDIDTSSTTSSSDSDSGTDSDSGSSEYEGGYSFPQQ